MKVFGSHLERAASLVRRLEGLECGEHSELSDVHLIVAENGAVECHPNIVCCARFRETVQDVLNAHNAPFRA